MYFIVLRNDYPAQYQKIVIKYVELTTLATNDFFVNTDQQMSTTFKIQL